MLLNNLLLIITPDKKKWDTTDIGNLNLTHLRELPIIQKPLVDTEQLDPDTPWEVLEPLKLHLPSPSFGPPELH